MLCRELQNKYRIITAYTLNNPNVINLEPPLIVTKDQIDAVIHALTQTEHIEVFGGWLWLVAHHHRFLAEEIKLYAVDILEPDGVEDVRLFFR